MIRSIVALLMLLTASSAFAETQSLSRVFDVPRLDDVVIDGAAADWGDRGFRVDVMASPEGEIRSCDDFDVKFRLGWNDQGLLVLIEVSDSVPCENEEETLLWLNDSIELFMAPMLNAHDYYQVTIAPGRTQERPNLRYHLYDFRAAKNASPLTIAAKCAKTDFGYTLECLMPWKNLNLSPKLGDEVAFQLFANDSDNRVERFQVQWYPVATVHGTDTMHSLRLSNKPSAALSARAFGEYADSACVKVKVYAPSDLAGKSVTILGALKKARAELRPEEGRTSAKLELPMPERGRPYGVLDVRVDGAVVDHLLLPDADKARAYEIMDINRDFLVFDSYVFSSKTFPECHFSNLIAASDALGKYAITTTYYDADYRVVTHAEQPGRYGAVIDIVPEKGQTLRRYRTLYRTPGDFMWWQAWWQEQARGEAEFPATIGFDPAVLREQAPVNAHTWADILASTLEKSPETAILFAGLRETKQGDPVSTATDAYAKDRQWWLGLTRQLNGNDVTFAQPLDRPKTENGLASRVLRAGSPQEASMAPDAPTSIDRACQQWLKDESEPFSVCAARNGVIFFHKAYGTRDGAPMTIETPRAVASVTKLLSATLMMQLVDQGLVNLDDPIDKFFPELREIHVATPLTVRHLYTHTNGFDGHWGGSLPDLPNVIAGYYPYLEVGKRHLYNGVGYALGGCIVEQVSGENISEFYKRRLLDPLGCERTEVRGCYGDAKSTALDLAKVAQMLLNRGTYGDRRFFSEATWRQMLPERLTKVLGPNASKVWGIGTISYGDEGLSAETYGHDGITGAFLRVDPTNDLVVTLVRNAPGKNYQEHRRELFKTIADALIKNDARASGNGYPNIPADAASND